MTKRKPTRKPVKKAVKKTNLTIQDVLLHEMKNEKKSTRSGIPAAATGNKCHGQTSTAEDLTASQQEATSGVDNKYSLKDFGYQEIAAQDAIDAAYKGGRTTGFYFGKTEGYQEGHVKGFREGLVYAATFIAALAVIGGCLYYG